MANKKEGPRILGEHVFDGIWYPNFVLDSSIERLKNTEVRSDDVWIVTFPKSGTHWMMEIVGLILADGYPEEIDRSLFSSTVAMINTDQKFPESRAEEAANPMDMTPFLDTVEKAKSVRVLISHLRLDRYPQDMLKKSKVIYVARNPKDIILSWFNFVGNSPTLPFTWEEAIQNLMTGRMHWGPWFEHVYEFWKIRDHENLLFVFYEDVMQDPAKHVERVARHIGRPLSEEALKRIVEKSNMDSMKSTFEKMAKAGRENLVKGGGFATFLNKGGYGRWKNHFTVAQNERFNGWYEEKMAGTGLEFTFE